MPFTQSEVPVTRQRLLLVPYLLVEVSPHLCWQRGKIFILGNFSETLTTLSLKNSWVCFAACSRVFFSLAPFAMRQPGASRDTPLLCPTDRASGLSSIRIDLNFPRCRNRCVYDHSPGASFTRHMAAQVNMHRARGERGKEERNLRSVASD